MQVFFWIFVNEDDVEEDEISSVMKFLEVVICEVEDIRKFI